MKFQQQKDNKCVASYLVVLNLPHQKMGKAVWGKNDWRQTLKNDHIEKKKNWLGWRREEPQIPNLHQKITKISSSILIHSKSRRNRKAIGKTCIRAELFLLPFCLLLLKLEAITGRAAPSCVYSSLTSFNLHSILNSTFAEFAALSYSTYSITWANWNCNLFVFNKQWTWVVFNTRGKEDFS